MPTRKKTQASDLSALLKGLNEAGVEFIVVGGLAAVIQGVPVTTFDLDIVHRRTDKNISKMMKFLKTVEAIQRRPDENIRPPKETDLKGTGHVLLTTNLGPLDVLGAIENDQGFDDLMPSAIAIDFKGSTTYVLSLQVLVDLKRESKIPEDQYRLQIYEETLRLAKKSADTD
jgi:hypothetical protein